MSQVGPSIGIYELSILCVWPLLSVIALVALRRRPLTGIAQSIWAFLIIVIPVLGPLAFFIVQPSDKQT